MPSSPNSQPAARASHWPEYLIEAGLLAAFMVSALLVTAVFEHPGSWVSSWITALVVRRACIGLAMGLTAIALIYSPWGQRSGAHMNPATTLTFWWLGKIRTKDALGYIGAQFAGGLGGLLVAGGLLPNVAAHPSVNYVVTVPGQAGPTLAFLAEFSMSGVMMLTVMCLTNRPRLAPYTGSVAGFLVFLFITAGAPFSGMSINPARTVASAVPSGVWTSIWIYLIAPSLGMFLAAQVYRLRDGSFGRACPKLHHGSRARCIFCGHPGAPWRLSATSRGKGSSSTSTH